MKDYSKIEAKKKIEDYFSRGKFDVKQTKKIKRLAMSQKIRLKNHRKRFCKKCLSDLTNGKTKVLKNYKSIICNSCSFRNRFKIK